MSEPRNFSHLKQQLLKDPEVKKAYDDLESSYTVASDLIRARLDKGLTQGEVAELAGVSRAVVMLLEGAIGNPRVSTVNKVAKVLGLRLALVDKATSN